MRFRHRARPLRVAWAPSIVRRVARHRLVQAALLVAVGLYVTADLAQRSASLDAERAAWGETTTVLVLRADVEIGEPVATSVRPVPWPKALVPPGAADHVAPEALARARLHQGEVLMRSRVDTADAALAGNVAITLAVARSMPLVEIGALVDLWTVDSTNQSSRRIAQRVLVLAVSTEDVTVSVPADQVGAVTAASLRPVTVAVVG